MDARARSSYTHFLFTTNGRYRGKKASERPRIYTSVRVLPLVYTAICIQAAALWGESARARYGALLPVPIRKFRFRVRATTTRSWGRYIQQRCFPMAIARFVVLRGRECILSGAAFNFPCWSRCSGVCWIIKREHELNSTSREKHTFRNAGPRLLCCF